MKICIVDGRGGGIGSRIVEGLRNLAVEGHAVVGLGLNVVSAAAMARAGATQIETREQAITQQLGSADMIIGPLSLLMPVAMLGEVTPLVVQAVLESQARKFLLPINRRKVEVIGTEGRTLDTLILHAIQRVHQAATPPALS
jgi:NAD(P)-dependent dehydrogenase (short-subunit alcohol dehydrogenase family)